MAVRRGVVLVLVLILMAVAVSAVGLLFLGLTMGGRGPQISANSTLFLEVGGDLQEAEPGGVLGQFLVAPPTVRSTVDALRKAAVDRRVTSVIIRPTGSRYQGYSSASPASAPSSMTSITALSI